MSELNQGDKVKILEHPRGKIIGLIGKIAGVREIPDVNTSGMQPGDAPIENKTKYVYDIDIPGSVNLVTGLDESQLELLVCRQ